MPWIARADIQYNKLMHLENSMYMYGCLQCRDTREVN